MEAYTCPAPYQSCGNLCSMVAVGKKVCCWVWSQGHCHLLLRGGKRLVGIKAPEEANTQYRDDCGMASQFCATGSRLYRCTRKSVLRLHQRGRGEAREQCMGRAATLQHRLWRVSEQFCRLGSRLCILPEWKRSCFYCT